MDEGQAKLNPLEAQLEAQPVEMAAALSPTDNCTANPTDNSTANPTTSPTEFVDEFLARLRSESQKNQLQLVQDIASKGDLGLQALMAWLQERQASPATVVEGKVHQLLLASESPIILKFLQAHVPQGVVELRSPAGVDYAPLAELLARQAYEEGDRLTLAKLCELAGESATKRGWIYFTEVERIDPEDLRTLDRLWKVYSEGKFGYSVQRELWLGSGKNWETLWPKLNWKAGNTWTRYPKEFVWDLSAPKGHLPLSNQLRGVRVISALLTHPAWTNPAP